MAEYKAAPAYSRRTLIENPAGPRRWERNSRMLRSPQRVAMRVLKRFRASASVH